MASTGDSAANTDEYADGGGIILKGASDHVLLWSDQGYSASPEYPELAAQAWTSSEHINLAAGKEFKINGVTVLSGTSLGPGITSIPGVTSFGTQNVVNIGPGLPPVAQTRIENNRISTLASNDDIEIFPDGSGNIVLNTTAQIKDLADPTDAQDAATKEYVDDTIETRTLSFSMDLSDGKPNSYIGNTVLANLAPSSEYRNGTLARILCTILNNSAGNVDVNTQLSVSTDTFNTPSGTAPAVTSIAVNPVPGPAINITVTRIMKTFQLLAGTWTHVSDQILP
jgi:hypothetical protein